MRPLISAVVALSFAAAMPLAAQTATVDPGMTRAEVIEVLGKPNGERTSGQYTYLFYRNGCEVKCGMQDLVILQNDLVVDAIFRSSRRTYTGESSSPNGVAPSASARGSSSGSIRTTTGGSGAGSSSSGGIVTGGGTTTPPVETPAAAGANTGRTTPSAANTERATPASGNTERATPAGTNTPRTNAAPAGNTAGANTGGATVTGAGVVTRPATPSTQTAPPVRPAPGAAPRDNPMTGTVGAGGIDQTKVLDNVPLNPRDTSTIQPSRTQGQLTPSARDQQPVPFSGSKPSPRDSAVRAKTGQPADTVKPPEE